MSRLDDQIERDLHVIADRVSAPPSPEAWASIQHRIATREAHRDTEVIMLTENTTTRRRWPLAAAAAAVIMLTAGAIAVVGTGGDDEIPAGPPTEPPPIELPPPTDEPQIEPTDGAVDATAIDEPEADAPSLSLTLAGTTTGTIGTNGVTDGDGGVLRGTETWTGGADLVGLKEGTYLQQGTDLTGELLMELDGSIDGVGRGGLTLSATIELVDGTTDETGQVDGGTLVVVGDIVGGTGALTGAAGTFEQRGAFPLISGSYTLELTVPAPDGPRIAHATGTWGDRSYRVGDLIDDGGPERLETTFTRTWRGEVDGESSAIGYVVDAQRGGATLEFAGSVAGIGTGTLSIEQTYVTDPGLLSVGVIVDGTGDLAGARGTLTIDGDFTYVMDIEVPAAPSLDRAQVVTRYATTQTTRVEGAGAGTSTDYTAEVVYEGALSGTASAADRLDRDDESRTIGRGDAVLTGTVEGVGTGTLLVQEIWRSSDGGRLVSMAVIMGGTDDFADAAGWIRTVSEDDGLTGEATIELRLPDLD